MTGARPKEIEELTTSIYLGSDGYWHAKVPVRRRPDGTVERKHLKRRREEDLRAAAVAVLHGEADARPLPVVKRPDELTLQEWIDRFLNERLPLAGRAHKTIYGYRSDLKNHVLPDLGPYRLHDLSGEVVEAHFARLSTRVSLRTLSAARAALSSAMADAMKAGVYPGPNPCRSFSLERPEEQEVEPYSLAQTRIILATAARQPQAARWSIALSLGFRQGEALGLRWSDIDLDTGRLTLRNSVNRAIARHGCGAQGRDGRWSCGYKQAARCPTRIGASGIVDKKVKSRATKRTIPLPPSLVVELKAHRAAQAERQLAAGPKWVDRGYVFTDDRGGALDPARDWQAWKELIREAGVPDRRLHDARHTAATILLAIGNDSRTVMEILGWSERRTADRYTHVVDELKVQAMMSMEALWQ